MTSFGRRTGGEFWGNKNAMRTTMTTTFVSSARIKSKPPLPAAAAIRGSAGGRIRSGLSSSTELQSLNGLIDSISSCSENGGKERRTIFVGGKGGVGKTTISSALAVHLASECNLNVLIVSTDPAHSLADALDIPTSTSFSSGKPVVLMDALTAGKLSALEIDPTVALEQFRINLQAFDIQRLASSMGIDIEDMSLLQDLGLNEFTNLLQNPPPGLDELVALAQVLGTNDDDDLYDVVIVDTAPTGHTLRLLALPQFLDGFLLKLLQLRSKLSGLANTLQSFLGGATEQANQRAKTMDDAVHRLEQFRIHISNLKQTLQNPMVTTFSIVTIPTKLAVAESIRLMNDLMIQGVSVTDIVVNQCLLMNDGNNGNEDDDNHNNAMKQYYHRRLSGQKRWIQELEIAMKDVSSTSKYQSNIGKTSSSSIQLTKVPLFDVELVGIPALGYLGNSIFTQNENFRYLFDDNNNENDTKFIICGGKGGVGKTTTSSSLAIAMASQGHTVALVSTDPAHSLGDVLDMALQKDGGSLIDCPLIGVPSSSGSSGSLSVLEVDPSTSLEKFKTVINQLLGPPSTTTSNNSNNNDDLMKTLRDLGDIFDTLPAGTDEVVALAEVISLLKNDKKFDRIVLDTAPTGHTLRMLSTPAFLSDLIERILVIVQRINSNSMIKMFLATSMANTQQQDIINSSTGEAARSALLSFQLQMYDLEDLFSNPDITEFLLVTIPTELAVRESIRLLNDLSSLDNNEEDGDDDMPIRVRNIVVNQILDDDENNEETINQFIHRVITSQTSSMNILKQSMENNNGKQKQPPPSFTKVPYLDTEPRGVYGLKVLAQELFREEHEEE